METPTTSDLRRNFKEQLEKVTAKISQLNAELEAAVEFRSKLVGGLETLQLIDPEVETENTEESED
jgi:hypothetical protein